jgi:cell division protein FtsI (penicillin-binding protein 3)
VSWAGNERWVRIRLLAAAGVFASLFVVLASRAYVLQVREAKRYRELAEGQYLKEIDLPSRRGRILDRNGAELAASAEVDSVWVNPSEIEKAGDLEGTARTLAKVLNVERRELQKPLSGHRHFAWLRRKIMPEEAKALRALGLPGVYLTKEPRRYYPNRALAGPVLGWAGLDGAGLEGLELKYDKELRGAPAEIEGLKDALGREVLAGGIDAPAQGGHDVVTTIDKFIQYRLEKALEEGVTKNRAKAGVAVAMDPQNGEILAMASVPGANPNDPGHEHGVRNRAVTDPFEPGSTLKTFSIAASIEAGVVKPSDNWFCENGKYTIGTKTIHDAERIGAVTTTEVLAKSSNICTAKIAHRSGRERVDNMLRRFGFGAPTGVDLPGERGGLLRNVKRWGEIELATISFGQGVTATPVQLAAGYAAIGNGGTLYRPHIVRRVLDEKGVVTQEVAPVGHRVVDASVAKTMRSMLFAVTQKGGTGHLLAIPGYPAGGKTGTAQKVDPVTRQYSKENWSSSFVGFAPLDDPRLLIFVMIDEPAGTHLGGSVAGPVWRDVMLESLRYLNVPPTEPVVADAKLPKAPVVAAAATPTFDDGDTDGETNNDDDGEGAVVTARDEGGDAREIPDFTGMSMGEVLEAAKRAQLAVEVAGSGRVVSQSPGPGPARYGARCRVQFAPPG